MRIHKHLNRLIKTQVFWESVRIIISDVKLAVREPGGGTQPTTPSTSLLSLQGSAARYCEKWAALYISLAHEPVSWENLLQSHRQGSGQTLRDGVRDRKVAMSGHEAGGRGCGRSPGFQSGLRDKVWQEGLSGTVS